MTIKNIVSARNKVDDIYQLILCQIIGYNSYELLDLAYPKHDGKQDAEAVAEMMLLRQSANSLAETCRILVRKLTDAIEVEDEHENK